jgi:hypothetical protein
MIINYLLQGNDLPKDILLWVNQGIPVYNRED